MTPPSGWQQLGEGVYRRRYRSLDLNVGAVLGGDQVLLVDTRSHQAEAAELRSDLRALTSLPCRQVVESRLPAEEAVRLAPFPAATARAAIQRTIETIKMIAPIDSTELPP